MHPAMDEEVLINLFSSFVRIIEAKFMRDDLNGSSKGYGFVKFYGIHYIVQATSCMNGYRLEGIKIWLEEPSIGNAETKNMVVNASNFWW